MENTVNILAPAKINIFLDVVGKRADGYHDIASVMQTVGIFDRLKITRSDADDGTRRIFVLCDGAPSGEENTAYSAAEAFFEAAHIDKYVVDIEIEKRIPVFAGLGGGSSDAAAVIVALNELYEAHLSLDAMMSAGAAVGADVPFCVKKGTCVVTGIGEVVESCTPMPDCTIVLAVPNGLRISTKEAYEKIDAAARSASLEKMRTALAECSLEALRDAMFNKFELILPDDSAVFEVKRKLIEAGAVAAMMSGSGSAVFGLFYDVPKAKAALESLDGTAQAFLCAPVRRAYPYMES